MSGIFRCDRSEGKTGLIRRAVQNVFEPSEGRSKPGGNADAHSMENSVWTVVCRHSRQPTSRTDAFADWTAAIGAYVSVMRTRVGFWLGTA